MFAASRVSNPRPRLSRDKRYIIRPSIYGLALFDKLRLEPDANQQGVSRRARSSFSGVDSIRSRYWMLRALACFWHATYALIIGRALHGRA